MLKKDKIISCLKLGRPEHSIKNFLILLPPFFGHRMLSFKTLLDCFIALVTFSLIASSVYILNDIFDREKDKLHPQKRYRPLTSGKISISTAVIVMLFSASSGCVLTLLYAESILALLLVGTYLIINIAYSLFLKNKPVIDIFILASGFVLRVYFGGAFFNVTISPWLFLCVLCVALYFAVGKRRNELLFLSNADNSRPVLKYYTSNYLNSSYFLLCGMGIVFFSLWTILGVKHNVFLQFSIPVAIFIMFRYNLIIESKNSDGDPVSIMLKDKTLVITVLLFVLINFIGIYFV